MILTDTVTLDAASVRMTRDGYLVADARIARTGIQEYRAGELGLTDREASDVIRVYRPESAVFDKAAMDSIAHRPLTNNHPTESVTAQNWKRLAIGATGDEVVRDGEFVRVPLTMMDQGAIDDWKSGKRQLSVGYSCQLEMRSGVTDSGEAFDAVQSDISANHIALCQVARGGPELRIGDSDVTTKLILIDGFQVEVTPAAEAAITTLQGKITALTTARDAGDTKVAELTTAVATKDAEIATLKTQLDAAKITPAKLRDAAKAYATTAGKAKALGVTVSDDADEAAIQAAVVAAKMGDAAKGWSAEQIAASFAVLSKDVAVADDSADPLAAIIGDGLISTTDAQSSYAKALAARDARLRGEKAAA